MFTVSTLICAAAGFAAGMVLRVPVERLAARPPYSPSPLPHGSVALGRVRWRPHAAGGIPAPPVLAVTTAALFAMLAWRLGPGLDLLAFLVLAAAGVVLTLVDLHTLRLPDLVLGPILLTGLTLLGIEALALDDFGAYGRALLGALVLAAYHFALATFRRGSLGLGDVKLAAVLGLHLSWLGWHILVVSALLTFACAGAAAAILLVTRRVQFDTPLPFGPWMLLGALGGVLYGEHLTAAYLGWG